MTISFSWDTVVYSIGYGVMILASFLFAIDGIGFIITRIRNHPLRKWRAEGQMDARIKKWAGFYAAFHDDGMEGASQHYPRVEALKQARRVLEQGRNDGTV